MIASLLAGDRLCNLNDKFSLLAAFNVGASMMRSGWIYTLWLCMLLSAGCSSSVEKQAEPQNTVEKSSEDAEKPRMLHIRPPSDGVFVLRDMAFQEVEAGDHKHLMPTNAERGFGFTAPMGKVFSDEVNSFVISSKDLDDSRIQITGFKGVAVNSGSWFAPVDDTNVAWIPSGNVSVSVDRLDEKQGGGVLVRSDRNLEPGFYVLHDDSMFRARKKDEVSAYYPFIVRDSSKTIWQKDAERCFVQSYEQYGEILGLEDPQNLDIKALKRCSIAQRLAWKIQAVNHADDSLFSLRTIYLSRVLDSLMPQTHREILEKMNSDSTGLEQVLWKIEMHDQFSRLAKLYQQASNGSELSPGLVQATLEYYVSANENKTDPSGVTIEESSEHADGNAGDKEVPAGDPQPAEVPKKADIVKALVLDSEPITTLAWVPFVTLDPAEPALDAFFEQIVSGDKWQVKLIELLGAIHYRNVQNIVQRRRELQDWFNTMEAEIPMSFKNGGMSMSFRSMPVKLVLGPSLFLGVPEKELSSWRATFYGKEKEVKECLPKTYGKGAFIILEQPLNGVALGKEISGVLKDPIDKDRKLPALDPETIQCILKVFGKMPSAPALKSTQKIRLAVSIAGD